MPIQFKRGRAVSPIVANVTANTRPRPPVDLVILGASGDLTKRLLLPGLGTLLRAKPETDVRLFGVGADDIPPQDWEQRVRESVAEGKPHPGRLDALVAASSYRKLDVTDPAQIGAFLGELKADGRVVVLYFALPPAVSQKTCEALTQVERPEDLRLAIEKPFGVDYDTARAFNALLKQLVPEEQVYRIDHFLGKATILNLLGFRFANPIFQDVWTGERIERIEIIVDEVLALEGRAGYYDHAGALKDMIQSHLLLVMTILAMDEPGRLDAIELRDLMAHTLRATHLWEDDPVKASRRARYVGGSIAGREVPSYVDEPGVDAGRGTETLAEVTVEIVNNRWKDVPIRLRSGKALGDAVNAIMLIFRPLKHVPDGFVNEAPQNVLVLGMKPETINLSIATNAEGSLWDFEQTILSAELGAGELRPYGEILDGIIEGDPLLSVRGDIAEECWRILTPVVQAWADGKVPMDEYRAGSSGPNNWR